MSPSEDPLGDLFLSFMVLSMLAFGGANAVVPEMQRLAVDSRHWMSGSEFTALFAIAQAMPGPNMMIATLVGWKAAGLTGAAVATVAFCGPSCLLTFWASKLWDRYRDAPWRRRFAAALAPVVVGLVATTAWVLARGADLDARLALITLATAAVAYFTRLNPLWAFAAAGCLGFLGLS